MSGGDDFCALGMGKGADRDGAASLSACSSLGSACSQGTQHHAVPGSGRAEEMQLMQRGQLCLHQHGSKPLDFEGTTSGPQTDKMYSVQPFCD